MTTEAKAALGTTIRGLRKELLERLDEAMRKEYLLDLPLARRPLADRGQPGSARPSAILDAARLAKRLRFEALGVERATLVKQAAYTLINRLVVLKLMEGLGLRRERLVTGGTESRAYRDFRDLSPAVVGIDDSEGYALLLDLAFHELALDLPGLFGQSGAASALSLVPVPAFLLREVIRRLDAKVLESCWRDDMTLGWVYQYWNDPEREDLDAKIAQRKKLEPGELASKTQMFTERYMVDWLLQNSLGPMWLAMCKKHGWTPDCERGGDASLLARLDVRRAAWREQRERGEVGLTALMPLDGEDEARWAYYVPQPIPDDAVTQAPESLDALKLLDPAVGSGHFLMVAFDLLLALHREEDHHRGRERSDAQRAEHIVEHNLYGIDLDPRAVQIAAAALWLKVRAIAGAQPRTMNLVSSQLRLAELPAEDPALDELRRAVRDEVDVTPGLVDTIIDALRGADWLGSLLKIDAHVEEAIVAHDKTTAQTTLFEREGVRYRLETTSRPESLMRRLERFLAKRTHGSDLGLRLHGEQLASGVRLVRMLREGQYDLVVGNPPYQGTAKMRETAYLTRHYPRGKADLYAMFLERGLQLVRPGGVSALLTMRGWMFIKQFAELRQWLVREYDLRVLGDLSSGAFEEISAAQVVVAVAMSIFARAPNGSASVAMRLFDDRTVTAIGETQRKRAATLAQVGRHEFRATDLRVVPEWPLVYWWPASRFADYRTSLQFQDVAPVRQGLITSDNARFVRCSWELMRSNLLMQPDFACTTSSVYKWVPYIKGAAGRVWFEPLTDSVLWHHCGLQIRTFERDGRVASRPQNLDYYFRPGVAYVPIGNVFAARLHRFASIFDSMGASVFHDNPADAVCVMNSTSSRQILESLNPSVHFQVGDVNRLPLRVVADATQIVAQLDAAFTTHESHREPSVEFRRPGPSPWRHAQAWAQLAVDRPEGAPLPPYLEQLDPEPPSDHLSYALGVALGRFGPNGEGVLDPRTADLGHALPNGLLFLDGSLAENEHTDSLGHPATAPLFAAWEAYGPQITKSTSLRDYLREKFFATHKAMYDNRPIHWPLSSSDKRFVVWVTIHRMDALTLTHALVDHLVPRQGEIQGLLNDLIQARGQPDKKAAADADTRYGKLYKVKGELDGFIETLRQLAERGPPPPDPKTPARMVDARYAPDLDDGVMINSAALWPVLEPLWKDPKKWWKELATAGGKKDYDWSHLAMRYFPNRVDDKCQKDPSLGVAHGCFWHYHWARAFAWELRLQDEIAPDFRITEAPYRDGPGDPALRTAFIANDWQKALDAIEKELVRRRRNAKGPIPTLTLLDPGLWTAHPGDVYELELAFSKKQGAELRILAPDEPTARATFESQNPTRAASRRTFVAGLKPAELDLTPDDDDRESDEATEDDENADTEGE